MDIQLSTYPLSLDLLLGIGMILILVTSIYLVFLIRLDKARRTFEALQPNLCITRSETVYANGEDTLTFYIQNTGGSKASNVHVTLKGRDDAEYSPIIRTMYPDDFTYEVWVKATEGSPLLQEKQEGLQVEISYKDLWGHRYSLTQPIAQREMDRGWFALKHIEDAKTRVSKPVLSYLQMRKRVNRVPKDEFVTRRFNGPSPSSTMLAMKG